MHLLVEFVRLCADVLTVFLLQALARERPLAPDDEPRLRHSLDLFFLLLQASRSPLKLFRRRERHPEMRLLIIERVILREESLR